MEKKKRRCKRRGTAHHLGRFPKEKRFTLIMNSYKQVLKIGKCAHEWHTPASVTVEYSPFKLQLHVHYLNTWGFPGGSDSVEPTRNAGDPGLIPGQEDPLEKGMATHSSILAWRIPLPEETGRLQSMGVTKSQTQLERFTYIKQMYKKRC